jgi:hypothetical protein
MRLLFGALQPTFALSQDHEGTPVVCRLASWRHCPPRFGEAFDARSRDLERLEDHETEDRENRLAQKLARMATLIVAPADEEIPVHY